MDTDGGDGGDGAAEVCELCENETLKPNCMDAYDNCIASDPGGNVEEKCTTFALSKCRI